MGGSTHPPAARAQGRPDQGNEYTTQDPHNGSICRATEHDNQDRCDGQASSTMDEKRPAKSGKTLTSLENTHQNREPQLEESCNQDDPKGEKALEFEMVEHLIPCNPNKGKRHNPQSKAPFHESHGSLPHHAPLLGSRGGSRFMSKDRLNAWGQGHDKVQHAQQSNEQAIFARAAHHRGCHEVNAKHEKSSKRIAEHHPGALAHETHGFLCVLVITSKSTCLHRFLASGASRCPTIPSRKP